MPLLVRCLCKQLGQEDELAVRHDMLARDPVVKLTLGDFQSHSQSFSTNEFTRLREAAVFESEPYEVNLLKSTLCSEQPTNRMYSAERRSYSGADFLGGGAGVTVQYSTLPD